MAFEDNPKVQELLGILQSLEIGERGLDTPAERKFIADTVGQGTALTDEQKQMIGVMDTGKTLNPLYGSNYYEGTWLQDTGFHPKYLEADADITKLGIGDRGLNTPTEREFLMKQQAFEAELMKLPSADLSSVLELLQGLTPVEKQGYMSHVLENGFSYGTINEPTPLRQQGFEQYNTGTGNLQNLGFGY